MLYICGLIVVFAACLTTIFVLNIQDKDSVAALKRSELLSRANNKDEYVKARDVFGTLKEVGLTRTF